MEDMDDGFDNIRFLMDDIQDTQSVPEQLLNDVTVYSEYQLRSNTGKHKSNIMPTKILDNVILQNDYKAATGKSTDRCNNNSCNNISEPKVSRNEQESEKFRLNNCLPISNQDKKLYPASKKYKILVFSWNTESVPLCETLDKSIADRNRSGWTTWRYSYNIPDFFPNLAELIRHNKPDIVVIGFQEDRHPGSYFHSHFLPEEMPKLGYGLVKRTKLMGVGITSYKGSLEGDLFQRGIRLSIYAKAQLVPMIEKEEAEMRRAMGNNGQSEYVCTSAIWRNKGAVGSYLMLPGFGRLVFICAHLPFSARSLRVERQYNNQMLRQNELNYSNICFNNIVEQLVLFKKPSPSHVICFGDFNYRISDHRPASLVASEIKTNFNNPEYIHELYNNYDELHQQMIKNNIYMFLEGVNNEGPTFLPTCKMSKDRYQKSSNDILDGHWSTGKEDQRVPSWCDRVLYKKFSEDGHHLICTNYERFDVGSTMSKSDHAGVFATFELW
jgi:hypothetical protein